MGVWKKSDFTPKPPKGGFIICWISISPPGGFIEIKRVDFFNIPIFYYVLAKAVTIKNC
jgi:hypothetical protein